MQTPIRVFIVDDHPIFRQGLRQAIEHDPRLSVVGEAGDGASALQQIKTLRPDVAVLDIEIPGGDGLDVARALQTLQPAIPAIVLTMHKDEAMVNAALDAGVRGYIVKDNAVTEVVEGVKAVAAGQIYLCALVSGHLLRRRQRTEDLAQQTPGLVKLTPMERRVLKLVAENKTSREIGQLLFISPRTVETHRARVCEKLNLHGSHPLLQFALAHKSEL
jgi:two-component system, NarL family, response regulator DegU